MELRIVDGRLSVLSQKFIHYTLNNVYFKVIPTELLLPEEKVAMERSSELKQDLAKERLLSES